MSVIIDNNLILSPPEDAPPLTHARIGYRTIWRKPGATVTASSEETDFPASAAAQELTYEFWRPTSLPATWEVDAGEPVTVDYCGIASHTLAGNTVEVQYFDGDDWQTVSDVVPGDDTPLMFLFEPTEAARWRIRISGGDVPSVGVVFFGRTLAMQRSIYGGHSPLNLSRSTTREPNRSDRGQWLGLSLVRRGVSTDYSWQNLTAAWYRENFDPFVEYATQSRGTFFIAWRPNKFPDEVGYCWVDQDDIQPSNMGQRDLMQVDMTVRGQIAFETPDVERFA